MLSLCAGILITEDTRAESAPITTESRVLDSNSPQDKIAPDLREQISSDSARETPVKVILQYRDEAGDKVKSLLKSNNIQIESSFENFNSCAVQMPVNLVDKLAAYDEVSYISLNGEVKRLGHITATTGANLVRPRFPTSTSLDGTGIGIAILDSGIARSHSAFRDGRDPEESDKRVIAAMDFSGETPAIKEDDLFGHGSHVASVAAGNGRIANAAYVGIAPNANIINLRVLNKQGLGTAARVINALNWILKPVDPSRPLSANNPTNQKKYNIRVVNMSLGMLSAVSYRNDPLCKAARKLVDAGIVVVAAAGNNGKNNDGNKMYGLIHTPGNEPSVITVGATNTFGTDGRNDDQIATYSSRGPTRSYWTDSNRVRHHDNLIKPDLVAPGNKVIAARSDIDFVDANGVEREEPNYLVKHNSQMAVHCNSCDSGHGGSHDIMLMNGTSVAAPVVAASQSEPDAKHDQSDLDVHGTAAQTLQYA
jgi:serine protease AprX